MYVSEVIPDRHFVLLINLEILVDRSGPPDF